MTIIAIPVLMAFCGFIGFTFGDIHGYEAYQENEKKAQAFWKEIEEKGWRK